jgi:hypothetical protein
MIKRHRALPQLLSEFVSGFDLTNLYKFNVCFRLFPLTNGHH